MAGKPLRKARQEQQSAVDDARRAAEIRFQRESLIASVHDVLVAARQEALPSIGTLAEIRDDRRCPPHVRLVAAVALLDRAYGKPHQMVVTADVTREALALDNLSAEELMVFERLLAKANGRQALLEHAPAVPQPAE